MPVAAVRAAVKTAIASGFSAATVLYENEHYTPPESQTRDPWVEIEVFGGDYTQESLGAGDANRWDERGSIFVHVFVPSGDGMDTTDTLLGLLAAIFKGQEFSGGYEMQDMQTGPGALSDELGNWWRTTMTVDWVKRGA